MKKSIKNIKKSIKNKRIKKSRKSKIKKGGQVVQMGEINLNFFNKLPDEIKDKIKNYNNNNNNNNNSSIEDIQEKYSNFTYYELYDFIFDNNKKLIKIWFHGANNISSITGGLPGIHIYVIKKNDNNYEIIGKFIRT
jgi:polyhydroxyalkanoate synthesis regulator phasin